MVKASYFLWALIFGVFLVSKYQEFKRIRNIHQEIEQLYRYDLQQQKEINQLEEQFYECRKSIPEYKTPATRRERYLSIWEAPRGNTGQCVDL